MKGVILAGGLGTRLYPLTHATNKHLLPVYDKPMVYYPIQTLVNVGIKDIILVIGGPHAGDFIKVLRNGEEFGLNSIQYIYQEGEGGISAAISLTEKAVAGDDITVILGDNTTDADISKSVNNFTSGAVSFFKEVKDPRRFGVAVFDKENNLIEIEEKPKEPKSNFANTGLYIFDNTCFERIKSLAPSARGELEVPDLQNTYINDKLMKWSLLEGFWHDAGTFETLFEASEYWANKKRELN